MKGKKHSEESKRRMRMAHLGKKHSSETIEKFRAKMLGRRLSEEHKEKIRQSHIGHFVSQETKEKISKANLGKKKAPFSIEGRKNMGLSRIGEKHWAWSGENVSYLALHSWVSRRLGKPETCEHCGRKGLTGRKIHWANKSQQYKRDLTDWLRLCVPCHSAYDLRKINI